MECVARRGRPRGTGSDPEFARVFGERLKAALAHAGLQTADLAHFLGKTRQQAWTWVSGETAPTLELAAQISIALGVSLDYLAGLSDEM